MIKSRNEYVDVCNEVKLPNEDAGNITERLVELLKSKLKPTTMLLYDE